MKIMKSFSPICFFVAVVNFFFAVLCFDKQTTRTIVDGICVCIRACTCVCYDLFIWFRTLSHNLNNYSSGKFQMRTIWHEIAQCNGTHSLHTRIDITERKNEKENTAYGTFENNCHCHKYHIFLCATEWLLLISLFRSLSLFSSALFFFHKRCK